MDPITITTDVARAAAEALRVMLNERGNHVYKADVEIIAAAIQRGIDSRDDEVMALRAEILNQGRALEDLQKEYDSVVSFSADLSVEIDALKKAQTLSGAQEHSAGPCSMCWGCVKQDDPKAIDPTCAQCGGLGVVS